MTSRLLANSSERAVLMARLQRLAPDSKRQWGRMTAHQAVCHLSDSFRAIMNPVPTSSRDSFFMRTLGRWIAIRSGLQWPHGVKTMPEVDQEIGGTKPVEFRQDRLELQALIEQFAGRTAEELRPHPIFGRMSTAEWQRWGWLHMDHHLRQFGQ